MTQTRPRSQIPERELLAPPPHPHYALGTLIAFGILGTLVAVGLAIASLVITAGRNSVDDALVAGKVETYLSQAGAGAGVGDVLPDLVRKEQLAVVPASEINVAVAPEVPPPSGRTAPAIVEVHFEVVEGISTTLLPGSSSRPGVTGWSTGPTVW